MTRRRLSCKVLVSAEDLIKSQLGRSDNCRKLHFAIGRVVGRDGVLVLGDTLERADRRHRRNPRFRLGRHVLWRWTVSIRRPKRAKALRMKSSRRIGPGGRCGRHIGHTGWYAFYVCATARGGVLIASPVARSLERQVTELQHRMFISFPGRTASRVAASNPNCAAAVIWLTARRPSSCPESAAAPATRRRLSEAPCFGVAAGERD
jgi:hypothetical protein